MFYAHGHYVKVNDLDVTPTITPETAKNCFANYKGISSDSVTDFISEIIIKEIPIRGNDSILLPKLVYRIYLYANCENNTEVGFVDAHTCEILSTEPALTGYSATGTLATRYSGSRQGITHNYSGAFHLADSTRGAIIHTWNLNNTTNILSRSELSDNDNNWTSAEHSASENDMGLDVHWVLQQIYDRLNNVHGINSFNDNGFAINAYVRYGTTSNERDNAFWNLVDNVLLFGDGVSAFRPVASVDAVGHEFGHGISDLQMGWPYTGDRAAFHEGMSDIWGIIFENRIAPNSIWQMGEQITISYGSLRNIQNTNDPNVMKPISDTYLSAQYNSGDLYVRSGVLSHWFYLLSNGGSGTNGIGNAYNVYGMGMDIAENLIIEAVFNNYLNNITTYPGLRTSMVNAATALCGPNSLLVRQVENAWYAVGVGTQPTQVTLTGASQVCNSGTSFTVNNLPSGCTINWTYSSNLQAYYGGSNYIALRAIGNGSGWVKATINSSCGQIILPQKDVWVGPHAIIDGINSVLKDRTRTYTLNVLDGYAITNYNWSADGGLIAVGSTTSSSFTVKGVGCGDGIVSCSYTNSCGSGNSQLDVEIICETLSMVLFPNPTSDIININLITTIEPNKVLNDANSLDELALVTDQYTGEFEIQLWSEYNGLIKKIRDKNNPNLQISLKDKPRGVYFIHLIVNGEIIQKEAIILND